jgi:4-diphosphocytidyl-2-C-methyl-D-erythritol kinase
MGMKLRAYAKINIGLHILGKRSDGFHDLETIFHEIDLYDEIELEVDDRLAMTADSILVPIDGSNLCLRAALLMQKEKDVKKGVMIHLKKNIPIGAGLGGGSSDAAAVLRGLNQLWRLDLPYKKLRTFASQLGADVPFFIEGGSAYATGRGEILEHFSMDMPYWIVLVTPPIHVSTSWAYGHLKLHRDGKVDGIHTALLKKIKEPKKLQSVLENDFESSVFEAHPDIHTAKKQLLEAGSVFSLMSGSGSSVFGFFKEEQQARETIASFPKNYHTSLTASGFKPYHQPVDE